MRDDLLELSRTIDPPVLGERIRAARLRSGLTQAQVAGEAMSVGYISRIESGQRRPDPELLEQIAGRLEVDVEELLVGVAPDQLVELQVALDHAELALATGSPAAALEPLARILVDPRSEPVPDVRRRASYLQASALEATGDLQGAILVLEDLAESGPQDLQWLTGLTALCRCYRESGELGRAIEIGTQGARFVEEHDMGGLDESVRLTLSLAASYFEQGDADYAARLCKRVIGQAEEKASPVAKASAYWNLSIIESMRGNAGIALPMTRRALSILETTEDSRSIARLRTQLGMIQLRTDPPEPAEALELLRKAETELKFAGATTADLADNKIAQARAQFLLSDFDAARRCATAVVETTRTASPIIASEGLALLGQIAGQEGSLQEARSYFQDAVLLLSGVGADQAVAQLWYELGSLLEGVGDSAAALDAYRRAAASTGLVRPVSPVGQRQATH